MPVALAQRCWKCGKPLSGEGTQLDEFNFPIHEQCFGDEVEDEDAGSTEQSFSQCRRGRQLQKVRRPRVSLGERRFVFGPPHRGGEKTDVSAAPYLWLFTFAHFSLNNLPRQWAHYRVRLLMSGAAFSGKGMQRRFISDFRTCDGRTVLEG